MLSNAQVYYIILNIRDVLVNCVIYFAIYSLKYTMRCIYCSHRVVSTRFIHDALRVNVVNREHHIIMNIIIVITL